MNNYEFEYGVYHKAIRVRRDVARKFVCKRYALMCALAH